MVLEVREVLEVLDVLSNPWNLSNPWTPSNPWNLFYAVFLMKKSTSSDDELSISTLKYSTRPVR